MEIPVELQKIIDPDKECCCIYSFSNKCKEWAYEKDFYLYSIFTFAGEGFCYITKDDDIQKRISSFSGDTEPEAIFKACEYILNKDKQ